MRATHASLLLPGAQQAPHHDQLSEVVGVVVGNEEDFQLCLGIPWGIEATTENMVYMRNNLPSGCLWYAFAIGPQHFPMATDSIINGGL